MLEHGETSNIKTLSLNPEVINLYICYELENIGYFFLPRVLRYFFVL